MEPNLALKVASILFGITALGGLSMAVIRFRGAPRPPSWIAMLHGVLAASGLTVLIYAAATVGIPPLASIALGLFILAAFGGLYLNLQFHAKELPLPIWVMIAHALLAATGFACLLISAFKR